MFRDLAALLRRVVLVSQPVLREGTIKPFRSTSGSLAMLAAMRRASSRVGKLSGQSAAYP